jgi:hypothetical protein
VMEAVMVREPEIAQAVVLNHNKKAKVKIK